VTRDDIIGMAREAGFEIHERKQQVRVGMDALIGIDSTDKLERFAALVASAEREACEKVCEIGTTTLQHPHVNDGKPWETRNDPNGYCAAAIRARQTA
jgi:hypothetical protein